MYHSGNSELEQLEDRHYRFNQKLSELEWDYADTVSYTHLGLLMSARTLQSWCSLGV